MSKIQLVDLSWQLKLINEPVKPYTARESIKFASQNWKMKIILIKIL